jgi:hypothetical protein
MKQKTVLAYSNRTPNVPHKNKHGLLHIINRAADRMRYIIVRESGVASTRLFTRFLHHRFKETRPNTNRCNRPSRESISIWVPFLFPSSIVPCQRERGALKLCAAMRYVLLSRGEPTRST